MARMTHGKITKIVRATPATAQAKPKAQKARKGRKAAAKRTKATRARVRLAQPAVVPAAEPTRKPNLALAKQYASAHAAGTAASCPFCQARGVTSAPLDPAPHKHRADVQVVRFASCTHSVNVPLPSILA